jgi:hypothetical protein
MPRFISGSWPTCVIDALSCGRAVAVAGAMRSAAASATSGANQDDLDIQPPRW